jgi:F-type H+-transporting ATPase subunit epsilon
VSDAGTLGAELVTPEAILFAGAADGVVLRTSEGDLTVLAGHTPLVGDVVAGLVRVLLADGTEAPFVVHGGFLQVQTAPGAADGLLEGASAEERTTRVTVLAGIAEPLGDVDPARAEAAKERAAAELASLQGKEDDDALAERAAAERALARAERRIELAAARAAQ